MTTLQKRLLVSAGLIPLAVYAIFFAPHWLFFIWVEAFIFLGLLEYAAIAEKKGFHVHKRLTVVFGLLIPFSVYGSLQLTIFFLLLVTFFLFFLNRRSTENALSSAAMTVFGLIYVAWLLSYMVKLHILESGPVWVFYLIFIVKMGDAVAYFTGKKFGTKKLIEHVSPKKSQEGALGQLFSTAILSMLSFFYLPEIEFYHLVIMGFSIGFLAQIGDLAESLIKRDAGIKDSGVIPGLGGILDVLDSLLFTTPFLYMYLSFISGSGTL